MDITSMVKEAFVSNASFLTGKARAEAAWRALADNASEFSSLKTLDIEQKFGATVKEASKGTTLNKDWAEMFGFFVRFFAVMLAPETPKFTAFGVWGAMSDKNIEAVRKCFEGKVNQSAVYAALTAKPSKTAESKTATAELLSLSKAMTNASSKGLSLLAADVESLTPAELATVMGAVDAFKRTAAALTAKFG